MPPSDSVRTHSAHKDKTFFLDYSDSKTKFFLSLEKKSAVAPSRMRREGVTVSDDASNGVTVRGVIDMGSE